jgi:hypothetical protein
MEARSVRIKAFEMEAISTYTPASDGAPTPVPESSMQRIQSAIEELQAIYIEATVWCAPVVTELGSLLRHSKAKRDTNSYTCGIIRNNLN